MIASVIISYCNIISIKKSASGSQIIIGNDTEQESIFKAAGTDALKKAASLLGIGTELYRDKEEQYIFDNMYNSLDYWEDEDIQKQYKKELQYLNNIQQKYSLSDYEIDETIRAWSNNKYTNFKKLPPEELNSFINYVKDTLAEDGSFLLNTPSSSLDGSVRDKKISEIIRSYESKKFNMEKSIL